MSKPVKAMPADVVRRPILSGARAHASSDTHKDAADKLSYLGLYDEAAPEYEAGLIFASQTSTGLSANDAYTLAELYIRGDRGDRAGTYFRRLWDLPADYQPELVDPEYARFVYPASYTDLLVRYASPRGVDPRFLLSIIRQESGFRPNVKSNAAARGLMQFTTTTADQTARGLGINGFRDDELYDPQVSILFGSQYAQQLFTLFPGLPEAVAASYNGGEDNMKRWLSRSRSRLPDRYVPEIAFAQSKDYVFRVMNNYRMYQLLYDENLELRPARSR
jgi:soluble lytic murein transglycosylase